MKDRNLYDEDELYENDFDEDDVTNDEIREEKPHGKKENNFKKEENFNKKAEKNDSNKKGVYSLNLTEGRIVFIFATFVIIVFTGIFSTIFIMSHISKKKITVTTNNKVTANHNKDEENQTNQEMEFNFYSELVKKNPDKKITNGNNKEELSKNNKKLTENVDKRKENSRVVSENMKKNFKENTIVKKENTADSISEDIVVLDDSEIIYSSKNIDTNNRVNIIETAQIKNRHPQQVKKEVFVKKGTTIPIKSETPKINNIVVTSSYKNESITPKQSNKAISNNTINNLKSVDDTTTRYVVQIGSFNNENKAIELEKFYRLEGYPTYIKIANIDGKDYYRLRVGPFKDKNRANEYLNAIKNSKYGKDSYLSKVGVM